MIVWLNGDLIESAEARIDPADRGFTLGDGLFETLAVRGGDILRFDVHCARLKQGCEVLNLPYPAGDLEKAIDATLQANSFSDAVMRLTLTRGAGPRGIAPGGSGSPTLLIAVSGWPGSPPPARCIMAGVTRRNERSPLARIKSINYLDNILARQEAITRGANEAILLNTRGFIAEATASNLFIVREGHIFTPPIADGALPGTMRAEVIETFSCEEKTLMPDDVYAADGVFLTNSLGIRTVASLDGKPSGNAARAFIEDIRVKLAA